MYGIKCNPTSIKNPPVNAILKRIHAVFTNMLHTAELDMAKSVNARDIDVFLLDAAWGICSTHHTVLKSSPGAAIFGRDMIFDIPFIANWKKIGEHKQRLTDLNTAHENEGRIDYDDKIGQEILVRNEFYTLQSRVQMAERPLDNHNSPYEWNNHDSMQKQIRKIKY
jgi:hypothetical protein